jgi:hypothetical protein
MIQVWHGSRVAWKVARLFVFTKASRETMDHERVLKNKGWSIIGLVLFIIVPGLLAGAFLIGATWLSLKALPWLNLSTYLAL